MADTHTPVLRAFTGLAGSAFSTTTEPTEVIQEAKRRGRPRKFKTNADRQYAYNKRKRQAAELAEIAQLPVQPPKVPEGMALSRGAFLADAPHGKGKLVSGGYDGKKIAEVIAAHDAHRGGKAAISDNATPIEVFTAVTTLAPPALRSVPEGQGPDDDYNETEREESFVNKQSRSGAFKRPSKKLSKKQFKKSVRRLFCSVHSIVQPGTAGSFVDEAQHVMLFTATPDKEGSTWALECGCKRSIVNNVTGKIDSEQQLQCA